ncbi:MAG: hypothetical protein AAF922_08925 [Pseudomonadota bacterium]
MQKEGMEPICKLCIARVERASFLEQSVSSNGPNCCALIGTDRICNLGPRLRQIEISMIRDAKSVFFAGLLCKQRLGKERKAYLSEIIAKA